MLYPYCKELAKENIERLSGPRQLGRQTGEIGCSHTRVRSGIGNRYFFISKLFQRMKATIESDLQSIYNSIIAATSDEEVVVRETIAKGASCKAMFSVYNREDLLRQRAEARGSMLRATGLKPFKARPIVMYAFYESVSRPGRLGSAAIYCGHAPVRCALINSRHSLFGFKVRAASVEAGARPFVDVRFAV